MLDKSTAMTESTRWTSSRASRQCRLVVLPHSMTPRSASHLRFHPVYKQSLSNCINGSPVTTLAKSAICLGTRFQRQGRFETFSSELMSWNCSVLSIQDWQFVHLRLVEFLASLKRCREILHSDFAQPNDAHHRLTFIDGHWSGRVDGHIESTRDTLAATDYDQEHTRAVGLLFFSQQYWR